MADIALFHSTLGVRAGIDDAAARLRAAGHEVTVVDQFDGRSFDDYAAGGAHTESVGFPELMRRAVEGVRGVPDDFIAVGFSNGGGMAEHVALHRRVGGVVLISGALPLELLGAEAWPSGVPVQIHAMDGDPFADPAWTDSVAASVLRADATLERFEYAGEGHLFMDPSLPSEFDPRATELLWERVLTFCA